MQRGAGAGIGESEKRGNGEGRRAHRAAPAIFNSWVSLVPLSRRCLREVKLVDRIQAFGSILIKGLCHAVDHLLHSCGWGTASPRLEK